jgi:predicted regulator of Ras-like GTPase activity (Roadblock/LC7/MglB family)
MYGEPLHKNELVIQESNNLINALRQITPSIMYASVTTDDGFEVTSFNRLHIRDLGEDGRVSSMVSSLQGLAEAIMSNLAMGEIEYSILTTDSGHFIARRVPNFPLVFAGVFDKYENLGKVLPASKMIAEQLAASINPNNPFL